MTLSDLVILSYCLVTVGRDDRPIPGALARGPHPTALSRSLQTRGKKAVGWRMVQQLLGVRHVANLADACAYGAANPFSCCPSALTSLPDSYACYLGFQLYTHVDLFADEPNGGPTANGLPGQEAEEANEPMMSLFTAVAMLTVITVVVAAASE